MYLPWASWSACSREQRRRRTWGRAVVHAVDAPRAGAAGQELDLLPQLGRPAGLRPVLGSGRVRGQGCVGGAARNRKRTHCEKKSLRSWGKKDFQSIVEEMEARGGRAGRGREKRTARTGLKSPFGHVCLPARGGCPGRDSRAGKSALGSGSAATWTAQAPAASDDQGKTNGREAAHSAASRQRRGQGGWQWSAKAADSPS
jgi:hypothetical protein